MLSQELDRETERYLADILAQEKTTTDALIRQLIRDRWLSLYPQAASPSSSPQSAQELPPVELSQPTSANSTTVSQPPRPKNSKQLIADFVRRKNGRSF